MYYKGAPNTLGVLQTLPHYKKISSRDLRLKELRIFGTETVLTFPSCLFIGVMRPLNLEEFDRLVASLTLSFFKNSHLVLMIRKIRLEINALEINCTLGSLKALPELRNMKDIMHICEVRRKL